MNLGTTIILLPPCVDAKVSAAFESGFQQAIVDAVLKPTPPTPDNMAEARQQILDSAEALGYALSAGKQLCEAEERDVSVAPTRIDRSRRH